MTERLFFLSHSLDRLAQAMSSRLVVDPFSKNWIITPSKKVNEWLKIELCRRSDRGGFLGLDFIDWKGAIRKLARGVVWPDHTQLVARLWREINEDPNKKWRIANRLSGLFLEYFFEGFEPTGWQGELFKKLFPTPLAQLLDRADVQKTNLFLFGIDSLPSSVERFFWRHASIHEYRFSPSAMFWQDLKSPKEKKRYIRKLEKQGVKTRTLEQSYELDHALLSIWGGFGMHRLELSDVEEGDDFEIECKAALHCLQNELLLLETTHERVNDETIQIFGAGASRLREVEIAKEQILIAASRGIQFSEMGLYVTNMEVYEPLVEFVFTNSVPFRIEGGRSFCRSPFYQGLISLFRCLETRWSSEAILELFENPSFRAKVGWPEEESQLLGEWIRRGSIRWALDETERGKQEGSWEYGIQQIAEGWVFLHPERETMLSWNEFDSMDRFLKILDQLKIRFSNWKEDKTLLDWGQEISKLILEFLKEEGSEVVQDFLASLKKEETQSVYPFFFIRRLFDRFTKKDSGGPALHGVRCAELGAEGALPADLVIVLGLDEESHPRKAPTDSFDQRPYSSLKNEDRYAFLRTVFSAREALCCIYRDRSEEDGKEMGPSIVLQELMDYLDVKSTKRPRYFPQSMPSLLRSHKILNQEALDEVGLDEMIRFFRNPIQFYLERVLGIDLGEEPKSGWAEFELNSFEWTKLLKMGLQEDRIASMDTWPMGIFGEELTERLCFQIEDWKDVLKSHEIDPKQIRSLPIDFEGVIGEANGSVPPGALHFGVDQIGGYLRRWPELVAILAQTKTNQIFSLKGKKPREVKDPQNALRLLKNFFLKYRSSLVPMHPEWIDSMLRKNTLPDAAPRERSLKWAIDRSPDWNLEQEKKVWEADLREAFAPLLELFPIRKVGDGEI